MTDQSKDVIVKKPKFNYTEDVKDFVGLVFHCPNCDEEMHLHISTCHLFKIGEEFPEDGEDK